MQDERDSEVADTDCAGFLRHSLNEDERKRGMPMEYCAASRQTRFFADGEAGPTLGLFREAMGLE